MSPPSPASSAADPLALVAARWARGLTWEAIPSEVVEHSKLRILDVIGVLLAASTADQARKTMAAAQALDGGGDYPAVGFSERARLAGAALVNGALSAILEFDDTHIESAVHASSPVLAVTLPYACTHRLSGRTLIRSTLIGSELVCRVGMIGPKFHSLLFHPTGLLGSFGAAYALADLLGFDADRMAQAVGLAGSLAAGSMSSWDDGSDAKSLQPGLAAASGVRAVELARQGLSGPLRIFESDFGFFRAHVQGGKVPLRFEAMNADLGTRWESLNIASKAYPSAFTIHPFVDAILALRRDHGLTADAVERITCGVPRYSLPNVCEPRADKLRPKTSWHARISVQHMVAEALVTGIMDKTSMTEAHIRDPKINALADRIDCFADPQFDDRTRSGGHVRVRLRDGREIEHLVADMRGTRANPISRDDYFAKFRRNADGVIAAARADEVIDRVMTLERHADVGAQLGAIYPGARA